MARRRWTRRDFLRTGLAGAAVTAGCYASYGRTAASKRPNILLILADDVGPEVLGVYGGTSYGTPNLDALARSGMRFNHAYAMPVCHPSRICLLTGRYPFRLGNPAWGTFPPEEEGNTFVHALRKAGYATAVSGKWQLTLQGDDPMHPKRLGFDRSCLFGWHEGPRYYAPHIRVDGVLRPELAERYGPDVYTQFLIDFMDDAGDQPFLAFYSMALCHDVTNDLAVPVPYGPKGRYDNYPEMVRAMDLQVGRLLSFLEERGLRENTVIFFCSDNGSPGSTIVSVEDGQYMREENVSVRNGVSVRGGKGSLTDGGTRVPFFVSWPEMISGGQVTEALTDLSDIFPTLVALAGGTPCQEPPLDGKSLLPGLLGQGAFARSWTFAEAQGRCWVRTQRWKRYADGSFCDAARHPEEETPLEPKTLREEGKAAFAALGEALDTLRPPGWVSR